MKIAIVGVGGVGGYFGGRLAQAGHDVTLIARGKHLEAITENGLTVETPDGNFNVSTITATENPAEVGVVDAVIVAVKGWQLPDVVDKIRPLMGENTLVLPLLNGVNATEVLSAALKTDRVLNGLCGIIAKIDRPGCIKHIGIDPFIKFGSTDGVVSVHMEDLKEALVSTSATIDIPQDIYRAVWLKYIFIAPLSGVTAVTRSTIGQVRSIRQTREMLHDAIAEAVAVGISAGIDLNVQDINNTIKAVDRSPVDGTTSMQRDIESASHSELESQTGTIVSLGRDHKVPTPVNEFIYAALLPQEQLACSQ